MWTAVSIWIALACLAAWLYHHWSWPREKQLALVQPPPAEVVVQGDSKAQFLEVFALFLSAESYEEIKQAMQEVRKRYPAFSESAPHMQVIADSLGIIESTQNRGTLESAIKVVRVSQAAMYDALPFKIDAEARAAQDAGINQMLEEGIARLSQLQTARPQVLTSPAPAQAWQTTFNKGAVEIDRLVAKGDWDSARAALQRIAYGMVDAEPEAKRQFTQAMCQFAARDPLYHAVMGMVTPLVEQTPGLLQTKLYPHLPNLDLETIRYVIYYAAEMGDLVRRKKGNSYAVFPKSYTVSSV
jgi:hypothetical protein